MVSPFSLFLLSHELSLSLSVSLSLSSSLSNSLITLKHIYMYILLLQQCKLVHAVFPCHEMSSIQTI